MTQVRLQIRVILPGGKTFGPGKADLLDLIQSHGSIAAAGRSMKMSYKRAWGLVEEMNLTFQSPLVIAGRGGVEGGGAQVTDLGLQVLESYRALVAGIDQDGQEGLDFISKSLAKDPAGLP
jgi:molybdate transport system regulatory protein